MSLLFVFSPPLFDFTLIILSQVRGQQYKYRGHVVHFLRDVGKVYNELPLLPRDLDIVILRPPRDQRTVGMELQFRRRFRIRRAPVEQWLRFLLHNHPGYRGLSLREDLLSQLPDDDSVFDQLTIHEVPQITDIPADAGPVDEMLDDDSETYDEAAVPNLLINESELSHLRRELDVDDDPAESHHVPLRHHDPRDAHQLTMPSLRHSPLNEFNKSQALLLLTCPTIFPRGLADFVEPRQRTITY